MVENNAIHITIFSCEMKRKLPVIYSLLKICLKKKILIQYLITIFIIEL